MYTEGFEQMFKMNKNLTAPLADLTKATAEILNRITSENLKIIEENASLLTEQISRLKNVRRPEEIVELQKECLTEDFNALVKNTQKLVHMSMENMEEFAKLYGAIHEPVKDAIRTADKGNIHNKDIKDKK